MSDTLHLHWQQHTLVSFDVKCQDQKSGLNLMSSRKILCWRLTEYKEWEMFNFCFSVQAGGKKRLSLLVIESWTQSICSKHWFIEEQTTMAASVYNDVSNMSELTVFIKQKAKVPSWPSISGMILNSAFMRLLEKGCKRQRSDSVTQRILWYQFDVNYKSILNQDAVTSF